MYREDVQIIDARSFSDYGISRLTSESIPLDSGKFYDEGKIKDPKTLDDLMDAFATRVLDQLGVKEEDPRRWKG